MPASRVIVNARSGHPARGARVVLGFSSGVTEAAFTGDDGTVVVEHKSTGSCTLYVNGRAYGTFRAPCKMTATLR